MTRQIVNIGSTGNDGTGDAIRDAFGKINENFAELYAAQGLEAGIRFESLANVIKPFQPNSLLLVQKNSDGSISVNNRVLTSSDSYLSINYNTAGIIDLTAKNISVQRDPNPQLANDLDAASHRLTNLSNPTQDQDAATQKWVYDNFLNRAATYVSGGATLVGASQMTKNFRIAPTPNNGNANLVGNLRYNTIKDADGVTNKLVDLAVQGTDGAHATRKDYVDSKISLSGTNTIDPATGQINAGAGVMTGPLILSADPQKGDPDKLAATKAYVDSKSFSSTTNLFVSTQGRDDLLIYNAYGVPVPNTNYNSGLGYPIEQIGRSQSKAFKSLNAAAKYARYLQGLVDLTTGVTVLPTAVTPYRSTYSLGGTTNRVKINLASHGFVSGDYVDVSGAISTAGQVGGADTTNLNGVWRVYNIFSANGTLDVNNFILDIGTAVLWSNPVVAQGGNISIKLANEKDGPYTITSKVNRGYPVKKFEITIFLESGVYSELLPIAIPANVAIKGDEFRRTIIRPAPGPAPAENANLIFVRGNRSVVSTNWQTSHYYHQLARIVSATINSTTMTISGAAYPPKPGQRFYVSNGAIAGNGIGTQYRVTNAVAVDPTTNPLPGSYTVSIVDDQYDPKPLESTLSAGSTIEFFLDNEHCDVILVNDAFQARNLSWFAHKGFVMAFDPAGQILTRSPYAQVCASFSATGGGGQLIDGAAGNQYVTVQDVSYNDGLGNVGATGTTVTITGALRAVQVPNTFYYNKKKYVILAATAPDGSGTCKLTLSATTPIQQSDQYLPAGFIPSGTQLLIETAGNRSMLSNDFTMLNDNGYGIYADNNGVTESVSQFTYYCYISYYARAGAQVRSVTGSSCYGTYGLWADGSNPNESIQVATFTTPAVTKFTPYIDNPTTDAIVGATSITITNMGAAPLRNATFQVDAVNVLISTIVRQTPTVQVPTPPLLVTTLHVHPYFTGQSVKFLSIPGTNSLKNAIANNSFTITVISDTQFTIDGTNSTLYDADMTAPAANTSLPYANGILTVNAKNTSIAIKGDPADQNFTAKARTDTGDSSGANTTSSNILKVFASQYPAVVGMKFALNNTTPAIVSATSQVYTVTGVSKKQVQFQAQTLSSNDNKVGATTLVVTGITSGFTPVSGWTFQLLDPQLGANLNYTRYTVTNATSAGSPGYYNLTITPALTVNMVNQYQGSGNFTTVDGFYDLTLDRNLLVNVPSSTAITFSNGYWTVNLNPALDTSFGVLTSNWGGGFVGYQKAYLLYMQKSAKVTQVLDSPTIILSSALQFASSSYDSKIYRIIGKSKSSTLSTAVYKTVGTATPNLGLFPNAKTAINNNTAFLINEAVAYVNYTYPTLSYNATKCARDVGYILSAIQSDILVGGASNSLNAGRAYWNSGVSYLPNPQQGPEVAALQYVQTLLGKVLDETTATGLKQPIVVSQTLAGSASESGASQIVQNYLNLVGNTINNGFGFTSAATLLQLNKTFIAAEFNAYIAAIYPSLTYNPSTLNTTVQAIVDAVRSDITSGTATQVTAQTLGFFSSGLLVPTSQQAAAYADALKNWVIPVMVSCVKNQLVSTPKQGAITQQQSPGVIYETGSDLQINYLTTVIANQLQYGSSGLALTNASANINSNNNFIKAELVAYLNATYVTGQASPISYHRTNFSTQVGNLVTAIKNDLTSGGASNIGTWVTTTYYSGNTAQYGNTFFVTGGNPSTYVNDAVTQLRIFSSAILGLVNVNTTGYGASKQTFTAQTVAPGLVSETGSKLTVNTLIQDVIDIVRYGYGFTNAQTILQSNKSFIQAEVIAFLAVNYPGLNYNQTKCSRDVGLIVDAITNDLYFGGNSNSVAAALQYYIGGVLQVPGGQLSATVAAIQQINTIAQGVLLNNQSQPFNNLQNNVRQVFNANITIETNAATIVAALDGTIANIVQNGTSAAPTLVFSNNIQTITLGSDATSLYYGGILSGTGIAGPSFVGDTTPATFIRASQRDPLGSGNYIVKLSQAITQTISANTEITVTGPGYDFVFDFDSGLDARHQIGDQAGITTTFSTVRATAHDFLEVGTGGFDDSNYPHNIYGAANNPVSSGNLAVESNAGRVFHVSTDQDGNFRVGSYFNVNQGDGSVSLQANINLTNVNGLGFTSGVIVTQFNPDPKMVDNADNEVPTQKAIVSYINSIVAGKFSDNTATPGKGLLTLDGSKVMAGNLQMGGYTVENVVNSSDASGFGLVNRKYIDNVFAGGTISYNGNYPITITSTRTNVLGFSMISDTFGPGGSLGNFGSISLNSNKITNLRNPSIGTDAANKSYVDAAIATGGTRTGWYGFTLAATPTTQVITGLSITAAGTGYTYPPVVTIVGGGGTGASIEATVSGGAVTGFNILNAGSGFTSVPTAIIGGSVALGTTAVVTPGSNFTGSNSSPTITFSPPQTSGGITATGTLTVSNGAITGVTITNPGSGYTALPTVTITGQGNGAAASVTINSGTGQVQNNFTISAGGTGYSQSTPPAVYFLGGGGGGASGTAVVNVSGSVTNIILNNPGSGYTSAPTIVFGASIGVQLTPGVNATATVAIGFVNTTVNVNSNRITNLPDPLNNSAYNQDPVTLGYLNNQLKLSKLTDITLTAPYSDTDFLVFTGTGSNLVNVTVSTGTNFNNLLATDITTGSAVKLVRSGNTIQGLINSGAITNSHIRTNASIDQSKINLLAATASATSASTVPTAAQLGVATFLNSQFVSNSGLIYLRTAADASTGISLSNLNWQPTNTVLANLTGSTGAVTAVTIDSLKTALNISAAVSAAITDTTLQSPSANGSYGALLNKGSVLGSTTKPIGGVVYFQKYTGNVYGSTLDNVSTAVPMLMPGLPDNLVTATYNNVTGTYNGAYGKYDIGSATAKWGTIYCASIVADTISGGASQPDVATSVSHSLFAGTDLSLRSGASPFNGRNDVTIDVVSSSSATASSLAKRDSSGDLFANNLKGTAVLTAGTGSGYTTNYYPLIQEDNTPGNNRYNAIMRRDYYVGNQTVGIRVGNQGDKNNYHYADRHIFNTYSNSTVVSVGGAPTSGTAYVDSANAIYYGTAQAAYYADVAEKYLADADYEPGTVLIFGGEKEVSISTKSYDKRVAGIVSTDPAYRMNEGLEGGTYVALLGRVPCKVVGVINKGDLMVTSDIPGVAIAADDERIKYGTVLGKALADYNSTEVGVIEVAVGKN
jgi:hypothetical protein